MNAQSLASFIWSIAELLRGDYKQSDYGKVILPFTVLRRLDCVLEPTKATVLAELERCNQENLPPAHFLTEAAQQSFFNSSAMDMGKLLGDPANLRANLLGYVNGFSENVRDIFEKFEFEKQVERLDGANLLFLIIQKFASVDLHPKTVSNAAMGHLFEELIRRFAELSNETAGEHFTPREVIRLMVNLLFIQDDGGLTASGAVRTIYDPTAGTGGMLSVAEEHLLAMNPKAKLAMHGQELNPESYAICKADMLVKGQDVSNIVFGNTLSNDGHPAKKFDYMLSNPPFGVDWKKVEDVVRKEHEEKGSKGRFGPGLPRVSDGSLLFLMHLVSKMRDPSLGGSRIGIVLNGSPMFTGGAGSGESDIRKFLLENDLVEAIVGLPTDMFYNTGIGTFIWILSNSKKADRQGLVQLIDASGFSSKMRKSLGNKRREISAADIATITRIYGGFSEADMTTIYDSAGKVVSQSVAAKGQPAPTPPQGGTIKVVPVCRIMRNKEFGYTTIAVDRPLRVRFEVTEASFNRLQELSTSKKPPSAEEIEGARAALTQWKGKGPWPGRKKAEADLSATAKSLGIEDSAWALKALLACIENRDPEGEPQMKGKKAEADPELRDVENVPLEEDLNEYFSREVLSHTPDAFFDSSKGRVGYEIAFRRYFYVYTPPRDLRSIDVELRQVTDSVAKKIAELSS